MLRSLFSDTSSSRRAVRELTSREVRLFPRQSRTSRDGKFSIPFSVRIFFVNRMQFRYFGGLRGGKFSPASEARNAILPERGVHNAARNILVGRLCGYGCIYYSRENHYQEIVWHILDFPEHFHQKTIPAALLFIHKYTCIIP